MTNPNSSTTLLNGASVVLDEGSAASLMTMYSSSDAENHVVAQNLILKVDLNVPINYYYLYRIARRGYAVADRMINRRTKAGREFETKFNTRVVSSMPLARFLLKLKNDNLLSKDVVEKFNDEVVKEIEKHLKSTVYSKLFDFKLSYKEEIGNILDANDFVKLNF
jgi:hypothetical protein